MTPSDAWYRGFTEGLLYAQAQMPKDGLDHDVLTITAPADDTFGPPNPNVDPMKPQPVYCLPFEPKKMWVALNELEDECRCSSLNISQSSSSPTFTWWVIKVASSEGMGYPDWFKDNQEEWS